LDTPENADAERKLLASREDAKGWYDFELRQMALLLLAHGTAIAVVLLAVKDLPGLRMFGFAFCLGFVLAICAYVIVYRERRKLVVRYRDLDSSVMDELLHYALRFASIASMTILGLTVLALGVFMWWL
jgi:hypothetical protein